MSENLKTMLTQKFNLREDQFAKHETDLQFLPDNEIQRAAVLSYLRLRGVHYSQYRSDVKGQSWYSKVFVDIPFMAAFDMWDEPNK
jgi:hypothetical protein